MVDHTDEKSITEENVQINVYLVETSSKLSLIYYSKSTIVFDFNHVTAYDVFRV